MSSASRQSASYAHSKRHTAQDVETLRDGHLIQIDTSKLVPGDIISLGEGDKVPADLRFLTGTNVRIDESLLTGESVPIAKQADALKGEKEIYERSNLLFQGSFVISGDVTAVVTGTGNATEFGQLAALAQDTNTESPVQKKIDKLISHVIAIVGGIAIVAFALAMRGGMELGESLRFVLALSVGNHLMAFLAAPALFVLLLMVKPRVFLNWKLYGWSVVFGIIGLSVHLFLPIRS